MQNENNRQTDCGVPKEQRDEERKALLETYNQIVDFEGWGGVIALLYSKLKIKAAFIDKKA